MRHRLLSIGASVLCMLLASCGGGGSDSPSAPAPPPAVTLNVAFGVKQLQFSWATAPGATSYRLFENADGASAWAAVGTSLPAGSTSTVHEIAAHRHNWQGARYALDACNSAGCSRSAAVATTQGMLASIGYVKASNTGAGDIFGLIALSADGTTLAVSALAEASNATGIGGDQTNDLAPNSGAVYVFVRTGGAWSQQAYLKASNAEPGDGFGGALALSDDGNTLAVGATFEDSNATGVGGDQSNSLASNSGAAYVFTRTAGIWSQQAYVKASNTSPNDSFGGEVTLSGDGNTLAVGATGEDSNSTGINADQTNDAAADSGAVYVFTRAGGAWSQQAYIKASNTGAEDNFSFSTLLSGDGNTLAVGALREDSNATGLNGDQANDAAASSGAVYVFARASGAWSQQAYLKASNTDANDRFGSYPGLSFDGNTLAVGARGEASNAAGVGGDQTNNAAVASGAVYVFTRAGTVWSQQAYVKASNPGAGDLFGWSSALSGDGNVLAVGAFQENSNATGIDGDQVNGAAAGAGAVYVFTRTGATWSQRAYVKATNTGANDGFGEWVELSGDGNTLAVAATSEDSNATGVGGDAANDAAVDSGAVYLH